jgi:RHS repeat-associated protein
VGRSSRHRRGSEVRSGACFTPLGTDLSPESTTVNELSYIGATRQLAEEEETGARQKRHSYSHDAYGRLTGMSYRAGEDGQGPVHELSYAYDPRGSVSMLLDKDGAVKAAYGYSGYGEPDEALTAERLPGSTDPPGDFEQVNPFRYSAKRSDALSGTIDMGARQFGPQLGQFLQSDRYDSALADIGLSSDPLTGNRYAFAGGNPISYVEVDGDIGTLADQHSPIGIVQGGGPIDRSEPDSLPPPPGVSDSTGTPGGGSGWTTQSSAQEEAGRERFQAGVESFHWPPTGTVSPQMAEDWLRGFERAHGLTLSATERLTASQALQQRDWYDFAEHLGRNPLAEAVSEATSTVSAATGVAGLTRQCVLRCARVFGSIKSALGGSAAEGRTLRRMAGGAPSHLDDVLRFDDRTFRRYLESWQSYASRAGGATRTADETATILQDAVRPGWRAPRGVETEWVGGRHINLTGPSGESLHFPLPKGFDPTTYLRGPG